MARDSSSPPKHTHSIFSHEPQHGIPELVASSTALPAVEEETTREIRGSNAPSVSESAYSIQSSPIQHTNLQATQLKQLQPVESRHAFTEYHYLEWDTPLADILALAPPNASSTNEPIDPSTEKPSEAINTRAQPPSQNPQPTQVPPKFFKIKDPFTWNSTQKAIVTIICCYSTITAAWASAGYSMGVNLMAQEWHVSKVQVMLGLPMFTIGFSLTPMIMSPLSEVYGRRKVLIGSQIAMNLCQLGCALVRGPAANLVLRFLLGAAASPSSSLVGGMIADCYHAAQRGLPMAFFASFGIAATGLGPLISGFVVQYLGWRWITWLQVIINGAGSLFCLFFMKETRGSVLLEKKAHILNKWMEEQEAGKDVAVTIRWRTKAQESHQSLKEMMRVSLTRPFYFLLTESVVFWFSIWVSFIWCSLYLFLSSIPYVFTLKKHFTPSNTGLMFLSLIIGAAIAQPFVMLTEYLLSKSSFISSRNGTLNNNGPKQHNPESRLYASCLYAPLLPIGILMFGFTAYNQPVYVPGIAMGLMTMGIYTVYLAVFNYLADTYHRYASSALAAQSMCRNLLGGFFPIVAEKAYNSIGVQNGSCVIAGVGVGLCVVPWVLVVWGEKIRARSKFCSEQVEEKGGDDE